MSFQALCPHCHKHANAPDGAEGRKLRCPHCQEMFTVQQEPEEAKAAAPAPAGAPASASAGHSVWEYHVEDIIEAAVSSGTGPKSLDAKQRALTLPIEQRLNALGAEGWELAGATYRPAESTTMVDKLGFWKLIFKRPRQTP